MGGRGGTEDVVSYNLCRNKIEKKNNHQQIEGIGEDGSHLRGQRAFKLICYDGH